MEKNEVILKIDNVRILNYDDRNVTVEKYELTENTKTKEEKHRWRVKGYYATVSKALKAIMMNEWLLDIKDVSDLNDHLKQVEDSNQKVLDALEGLK